MTEAVELTRERDEAWKRARDQAAGIAYGYQLSLLVTTDFVNLPATIATAIRSMKDTGDGR